MAEKTMGQVEGPRIKMDQARVGGRDARDTIPGIDTFPGRTVPEARPEPRKKEEIKIVGEPSKPRIGRKTRIALASLGAATIGYTGGAIVNEQINDRPVSAASIRQDLVWPWNLGKSIVEDVQRILGNGEVPTTFDDNAEKIAIGDNNTTRITPKEARSKGILIPQFNPETKVLALPFLLTPPEGTITSLDKSEYEVRTIKHNEPRVTVPAGTGSIIPEGMHYLLTGGNPDLNEDLNMVYGLTAVKYDKETNTTIVISLDLWDDTQQKIVPISTNLTITPAKDVYGNWESRSIDYWEKLPVSTAEQSVTTTTSNQLIHVNTEVFKGRSLDSANKIEGVKAQWRLQDGKIIVIDPSTPQENIASVK